MKYHPQAHIIDLGDALTRSMTPRSLTSGSIRHLPGEPSPERRQHGPITDLVRRDRCGCVAYEGTCDGEGVCLCEVRPWHWTARNSSGSLVREGALMDVLGVRVGDIWIQPGGAEWTLDVRGGNGVVILSRPLLGIVYRAEGPLSVFLADGWRPVAT